MAELEPAERFLVSAFRRWVLGLRDNRGALMSLVWDDFEGRFGARDGKDAMAAFAGVIRGLQCHARRRIAHHQPCCPCLGGDETGIVCFVAACQNGQPLLARGLAEGMVRDEGVGELLGAAARMARLMKKYGLELPLRVQRKGLDDDREWANRASTTVH